MHTRACSSLIYRCLTLQRLGAAAVLSFFFYHIALCIFLMERHVTGRKAFLNIFGSQIIFESNSYLYALSEDAIVFKAKFQKGQRKVLIITPQKSWREKAEQRLSR